MINQPTSDDALQDELPFPIPFSFLSNLSNNVVMLYSSARFYRTAFNQNIKITAPIGNNYVPTHWFSADTFIPINSFNSTKPITEISFPNNNSVQINYTMKFYHDIQIDFKLSKNLAGDGFQNMRKIQVLLVRADGTSVYDPSMIGYRQPGPNNRDILRVTGEINQTATDILKLRFNVVQDNGYNDQSDTYIEIYSIDWNMSGLKVINN
jgi:hypothetical protein